MKLNRKHVTTFGTAALFAVGFMLLPADALAENTAANSGGSLVNAAAGLMESNYGLFVGLIIAALGLWRWLMSQDSWGVMLIIGGIAITAFPGIFEGLFKGSQNFFKAAGSESNAYETNIDGVTGQ